MANRPELVLPDEPTGNLDSRTSIEIMGLLQALNQSGFTLVIVTLELDIGASGKRGIIMRDGVVISDARNERCRSAGEEIDALNRSETDAHLNRT